MMQSVYYSFRKVTCTVTCTITCTEVMFDTYTTVPIDAQALLFLSAHMQTWHYCVWLVLQHVRAGEVLMGFLCKITILKCFFFNLLLLIFVGAHGDWRQAIWRHYFSASAFLH